MKKDLIVQSNALVEDCYKLTLQEARIILFLASRIEPDDSDFKDYDIHNPRSGSITLRFDKELKPYLLKLKKNFTSFSLSVAIKFKNIFSFRIYELLKQYESIGKREISIDDLRWMLDLDENTYPLYGNFKQRVIKPIQKELKEKSDIYFDFDEIKRGRSIYAIRFIIHKQDFPSNQKSNDIKSKPEDEVDVFINELVELLPEKYQKLASYRKLIIKYFEQNGKNYVIRNILYANDKSNDINYRAYLSKSLENDYGLAYKEDQEVKKEEAERQRLAKVKEAKVKEDEKERIDKEHEIHQKASKLLKTLPEEEYKIIENEASKQLIEKNLSPSSVAWPIAFRMALESIFIERHPENFK